MFSTRIVSPFSFSPDSTQCPSSSFAKTPVKTSYSIKAETHKQASPQDSSHKTISFEKSQENIAHHAGNFLVLGGAINLAKETFNQYGKPAIGFVSKNVHNAFQNEHLQKITNSATNAGKAILGNEKIQKTVNFAKDNGKNIATTAGTFMCANPVSSLILATALGVTLGITAERLYRNYNKNQEPAKDIYNILKD